MICPHCGCFFCMDYPGDSVLSDARKTYCSATCSKRASAKRTGLHARARSRWKANTKLRHRCTGKFRYETAGEAFTALRWQREDLGESPGDAIYECADCEGWHVTSHRQGVA